MTPEVAAAMLDRLLENVEAVATPDSLEVLASRNPTPDNAPLRRPGLADTGSRWVYCFSLRLPHKGHREMHSWHAEIATRAGAQTIRGPSAWWPRQTSPRLLTGVEIAAHEAARGLCDSRRPWPTPPNDGFSRGALATIRRRSKNPLVFVAQGHLGIKSTRMPSRHRPRRRRSSTTQEAKVLTISASAFY